MSLNDTINAMSGDPEQLELTYQAALKAGQAAAFREAIDAGRAAAPDNMLYAAWHYRLLHAAERVKESFTAWGWAIPLALLNGLALWYLSDDERFRLPLARPGGAWTDYSFIPLVFLVAAPVSAAFVITYLSAAGRRRWIMATLISALLVAAAVYVVTFYPQLGTRPYQEQYITLMAMHLPLLAWAGVGAFLISSHNVVRDAANRFAFLIKSLEVFVMGGLAVIAGGIFVGITAGLFEAIGVTLPQTVVRLLVAGGGGLVPVIAAAVIYNPKVKPIDQEFEEGISRLLALLARALLPLSILVLLVYLSFIPFNFFGPFENRDVLIVFNAMLFAVIALMVAATPTRPGQLSSRAALWLRRGIIALAALAALVSIYALAAILYRTAIDRLTPNRLAFIGWNVINIGLLLLVLFRRLRAGEQWPAGLYRAFAMGTVVYAVWTLALILILPWLFGINQQRIETLPPAVQEAIYSYPDPILLKCTQSPHIYLLDDGEKRWIETIPTFTERGYVWGDVRFISCDDLRSIPDGEPIPPDAGPPPQP